MQLIVSILIVISGFLTFELRGESGVTGLTSMTYDSLQYIKIIEGGISEPPFSTRILLIYICRVLPFYPDISLLIVNYISMLLVLLGVFGVLNYLRFPNEISILAVIAVCSSFVFVYNFSNPYLTDLPAMASLVFFLAALQRQKFYLTLIFCCISLLFRESIVVLIPMFFLFFNFCKSVCASILAACTYIAPKILIAGNVSAVALDRQIDILYFLKFFTTYGVLWMAGALGYFILRKKAISSTKFEVSLLLFSFAGAVLSSFHAADITRMYFLILPSIVIGAAYFFDFAVSKGQKYYIFIFVLLGLLLSLFLVPNHFFPSRGFDSLDIYIGSNSVWICILFIFQILLVYKIIFPNKTRTAATP